MDPQKYPFVSFCLPSYNQRQYIADAVRGALAQDYPNMEVIISDDCSSDDSVAVIKRTLDEFGECGKKVTLLRSNRNLGIVGNYQKMFKAAKGELFIGADGDDISLPNRVSRMVHEWVAGGKKATVIIHDGINVDLNGVVIGATVGRTVDAPRGALMAYSRICLDAFEEVSELGTSQDHVYSRRCAMFGSALYISEKLVKYRVGSGVSTILLKRREPELRMAKIRANAYRQLLKDLEFVREKLSSETYALLRKEYERGLVREELRVTLMESERFGERWKAYRACFGGVSLGAMLYLPYLLPKLAGDFLFDSQARMKYAIAKRRRSSLLVAL